jgi:hypothetical protein
MANPSDLLFNATTASEKEVDELIIDKSDSSMPSDLLFKSSQSSKPSNLLFSSYKSKAQVEEVPDVSGIAEQLKAESLRDNLEGGTVQSDYMKELLAPSVEEFDYLEANPVLTEKFKTGFVHSLDRIWKMAQNPYDLVKGTATFLGAIPGFAAGLGSAVVNIPLEVGKRIIEDKSFTILDLYESSAKQLSDVMGMWEEGVTGPLGKLLEYPRSLGSEPTRKSDDDLIAEIWMAPYTAVSGPLHELADSFTDSPNTKGAIKFLADGAALAFMGRVYKGGPDKLIADAKPIVEKAKVIDQMQKEVDKLAEGIIKEAQQKVIDAQKVQVELEAAEVQKNLDYGKMIEEDFNARGKLEGKARQAKKDIVDEQVNKANEWAAKKDSIIERHFGGKQEIKEWAKSVKEKGKVKEEPLVKVEGKEEVPGITKEDRVKSSYDEELEQLGADPGETLADVRRRKEGEVGKKIERSNQLSLDSITKLYQDELGLPLKDARDLALFDQESNLTDIYKNITGVEVKTLDEYKGMLDYWEKVKDEADIDVVDDILNVGREVREEVKTTDQSSYRAEPERTAFMDDWFSKNKWQDNPVQAAAKFTNDVNSYLDGKDIDIVRTRNTLSNMAVEVMAPENDYRLLREFDNDVSALEAFKKDVVSRAEWARKADRKIVERSGVDLNMMIPLGEIPKEVMKFVKGMKRSISLSKDYVSVGKYAVKTGNIYRNKELWEKTGFWLGKDGKWRYEIPNYINIYDPKNKVRFERFKIKDEGPKFLPKILVNEQLYKDVPWLKGVMVMEDSRINSDGYFKRDPKTIVLKNAADFETLVHEVQHAVEEQANTKFKGSNESVQEFKQVSEFVSRLLESAKSEEVKRMAREFKDDYERNWNNPDADPHYSLRDIYTEARKIPEDYYELQRIDREVFKDTPFEAYEKDPGEMLARLETARSQMSPEGRKKFAPWETLDTMLEQEGYSKEAGTKLYSGFDPSLIKKLFKGFHGTSTKYIKPSEIVGKYLEPKTMKQIVEDTLNELKLTGPEKDNARQKIYDYDYFDYAIKGGEGSRPFDKAGEVYVAKSFEAASEYAEWAGEAYDNALIALGAFDEKPIGIAKKAKEIYDKNREAMPIVLETEVPFSLKDGDNVSNKPVKVTGVYDAKNGVQLFDITSVPSEAAKLVKSTWKELRNTDNKLIEDIGKWITGKISTKPSPNALYRGVPKGKELTPKDAEYTHGTPWGFSAARGGKGSWGDVSAYDVYEIPVKKDTKYYRGGSLAGDPLEGTRIKNAKGMTWNELLNEAKNLYETELVREKAKARRQGYEFSKEDAKDVLDRVINDLTNASFETDLYDKPGIWKGQSVPSELDKVVPKLRSYSDLVEAVRNMKRQGFSDADIPELKILNRDGKTVDLFDITSVPSEAAKQLKSMVTNGYKLFKSYKESGELKKFDIGYAAKQIKADTVRSMIDQSETLLKQVRKLYPEEATKIVNRQRSAAAGKGYGILLYEQAKKEITKGLSREQEDLMGVYVLAKRLNDIYSYKPSKSYKTQIGYGAEEAISMTSLMEMAEKVPEQAWKAAKKSMPEIKEVFGEITSAQMKDVVRAGEAYFEWMRKIVDDLVEAELKSPEEGALLKAHDFRKFKSMTVEKLYDFSYSTKLKNETIRSTNSGVESLGWGSHKIIEPDPWASAHEMFARSQGAIANQAAKMEWKTLADKHPENGIVSNKRVAGWSAMPYFENGKRKNIYFSPDASKYLVTKSHDLSHRMTKVIRGIMLAPVTRSLAVGLSPAWSTFVGLPMDVIHSIFTARVSDSVTGKVKPLYSPIPGVAMFQMGKDLARTLPDIYTRGKFFQDYMKYGGSMPFLSMREGRYTRGTKAPSQWNKFLDLLSYHGMSMETWVRGATADRTIRQLAKKNDMSYEEARKNKDIMYEAIHVARDRMDYNQGGWFVKALDQLGFIFLNAGTLGTRTYWRQAKDNPVDFTMKSMQVGVTAAGLATVGWMLYPHVMKDIPDEGNEKNLIMPLFPGHISALDKDGNKVYFYAKLRLDPGAAFMYKLSDSLARTFLYDKGMIDSEPDYGKLTQTLKQLGPYGLSLPPAMQGIAEYTSNYSWWKDRDMYNDMGGKTLDWPKSRKEGIYGEGAERDPNLSQMAVDVSKVTGLSPVRLQGAVGNIIPRNNEFVKMISGAYDWAFDDTPKELKSQHWMISLAELPGINKIIGVTRPGYSIRDAGKEPTEESRFDSVVRNGKMDFLAENYYWKGYGTKEDVRDYVKSFKEPFIKDALKSKETFIRDVKDLPNRSAWVSMFRTTPEAKAKHFYKLYGPMSDDNRDVFRGLMKAGYLSNEGYGRFKREMDKIELGRP